MVQLKPLKVVSSKVHHTHFNSIMVQLKPYKDFKEIRKRLFQFHNGTIKTSDFNEDTSLCYVFQFHNGTIKTNTFHLFQRIHIRYFNSIMVQLKPIDIYNGNLVFTEVSLRINVYFFAVKMSMYNESIFADLRQHLHLIFIVKG